MRFRCGLLGLLAVAILTLSSLQGFGLRIVTPAAAQAVISVISVEGNQRIEAETVRSYMEVSVGDPFDPVKIDESLKALFRTGLFADVQIFRRGNALVVEIEENPIINRINFEGNSEVEDKDLLKEVQLRPRTVFTRARVQADVQRIISIYRRSGLFTARVEPKVIRLPQNRVDLVFEVDEGNKTRIERINFVGNRAFTDSELRAVISTAESAWWKILGASDNYDPDRLAFDGELLRRHYLKNGYADFRVIASTAELARDGETFFINFTIEEGPLYKFGTIGIDVGETGLNADRLQEEITTYEGETYDANEVDKSVEQLTLQAGTLGFAFAQVRPNAERDEENLRINLVYQINEGPRVYIERIEIVGNVRTLDIVIRREMRLVEGDAYNRILVDRARRRITALDFFHTVDIKELRGSSADKVVLQVEVDEKSTGQLNFGAGFSTTEALLGTISLSERNLLGRGQFVRLATSLSFRRQQIDFSFTEPYFLGRKIQFGIDAFATETDLQAESSFDSRQIGGGLRFGFPVSENSSVVLRYNFTNRRISDVAAGASLAIQQARGTTNTSQVGLSWVYDTLDSPANPTSGFRIVIDQDLAGLGGDTYFWRAESRATYFYSIWDGVRLMLRGTGGYIGSLNNHKVDIIDRFYKGGESFRGFERSGIGPRDLTPGSNDDSLGGQAYAIGTAEISFPVGLPEEFGLRGAVFTDWGTIFEAHESKSNPFVVGNSPDLRASVGVSILWSSPLGPLRFDLAYPFLKESFDKVEYFRFSAGTRF